MPLAGPERPGADAATRTTVEPARASASVARRPRATVGDGARLDVRLTRRELASLRCLVDEHQGGRERRNAPRGGLSARMEQYEFDGPAGDGDR